MPFLSTSAGPVAPVFLQGFALGLGLIVAIGAQNAFVLRQGLRREHVATVVGFCALMDAALIIAGVFGMARALGDRPQIARVLALAGAAYAVLGSYTADIFGWFYGPDQKAALLAGLAWHITRRTRPLIPSSDCHPSLNLNRATRRN